VAIYPNGEHGKFFSFQGWLCKRGFTMTVRSAGYPMGSLMFRLRGKILVVNPSSGCGEAQHFADGLAPIIVQRIGELLRQLRSIGTTVLIAEQNMHFRLGLASHATVIDKG
jgi:hypothetical protein